MKKILIPVDFSPASLNALAFTDKMALHMEAVVDVIHIFSVPFADASATPPQYLEELITEKRTTVTRKLKDIAEKYPNSVGNTEAVYGFFPAVEIEEYAREKGYDMIAMGTRGEHSIIDKYLGSITSEVMLRAKCPVFGIPENAKFVKGGPVAYASDHHEREEVAIEQLKRLSKSMGAPLKWVHVNIKDEDVRIEEIPTTPGSDSDFSNWHVVHAASVMEGLDEYIKREKIASLALFIPKRRLFERLFHTSFTKKMAMHADIPLIVFHSSSNE